jgi:hypothetical protein
MKSIINLFWGICLLRQSPSAVPGHGAFVAIVVAANLVVSVAVSLTLAEQPDVMRTATGIVVGQATTACLVWLVLAGRNLRARFTTALAALFGCDLLITLCFGLVMPVLNLLGPAALGVAALLLMVWSITVVGFILHRAAEVTQPVGIGLALGMSIIGVSLSQLAVGT